MKPATVAWFGVKWKRSGNKNFQFPRAVSPIAHRLSSPDSSPSDLSRTLLVVSLSCPPQQHRRTWSRRLRGQTALNRTEERERKLALSPARESRQLANFQIYTLAVRSRAACFAETSATFGSHERIGGREGWVRVLAPRNVPFYSPCGCKYFARSWERTLARTDLFSCTNSSEVRSRDLSFVLLLRGDRQRLRLRAHSTFREHNEYLFTLISKSNYRGNKKKPFVCIISFSFFSFFQT